MTANTANQVTRMEMPNQTKSRRCTLARPHREPAPAAAVVPGMEARDHRVPG